MENRRRHIIVGYAVFTLLFLSAVFVFVLFRIDMFSLENHKTVRKTLENLGFNLELKYGFEGRFVNAEIMTMLKQARASQERLLVTALTSKDYRVLAAEGKSDTLLVNAQFQDRDRVIEYTKPVGASEFLPPLPLNLRYKGREERMYLSALYTSFSGDDSFVLLQEILFILLGFFGLTLVMIVITALLFKQAPQPAPAGIGRMSQREDLDLPEPPVRQSAPVRVPAAAPKAQVPGLEWSEEERETRKRERLSEATGLVKQEHLRERLGQEIERAVSFSEEMALILIAAAGPAADLPWKGRLTPALHRFFGNPELSFEYGEGTAAVIAPGMDIDAAIRTAKLVYKNLFTTGLRTALGITALNDRSITATLLIEEAAQALEQARRGGQTPIIAFRADAEKYKNYLSPP